MSEKLPTNSPEEMNKVDAESGSVEAETAEQLAARYREQQFQQKLKDDKEKIKERGFGFESVEGVSGQVGVRRKRNPEDEERMRETRESLGLPVDSEKDEAESRKLQAWIDKRAEIDEIADAEGKGIEPKIKEAVIALNLLGYETTQSCEGHSGPDQFSEPWIRIAAPNEPAYRFLGQEEAFKKSAEKFGTTLEAIQRSEIAEGYWEAIREALKNGESPEYLNWREQNRKLMEGLTKLLGEFYKGRNINPEIKLWIDENGEGDFELREGVQILPEDLTEENKKKISEKISACQAEVDAFTKFLRGKYLG